MPPTVHASRFALLVSDDEHDRHLLKFMIANAGVHLLIRSIELHANAKIFELATNFLRIRFLRIRDREHDDLHRREPCRKIPCIMLDKQAAKPLERSEWRAMDYDRPVLLTIGAA